MHADHYKERLREAGLFLDTADTSGWQNVFIPRLKRYMELEDAKCHNIKLSDQERHYAMGAYKALADLMMFADIMKQEREVAINYLNPPTELVEE